MRFQKFPHDRACFKKNSSLHISQKNFSTTFFRILPEKFVHFFSQKLTFFFSHRPFSQSSRPIFFIIIALLNVVVTPLHPPSMHTHMLFYTFLYLLCALVTINTP